MDKTLNSKRNQLINSLLESVGSELSAVTDESTHNIAQSWVDVADLDKNGTISFAEFKEFFTEKLDDFDEATLRDIFTSMNDDGNDELDVTKIASAIL